MTPSLTNTLFTRDVEYKIGSSVDSYHLKHAFGNTEPTDFGFVDLWALYQKVEMPLYQMANFSGKNILEVDDLKGEYKIKVPIVNDLPYIVEDIEPSNTPGMDGHTFRIKLNRRMYSHGQIITYDKYTGAELYITAEDILPAGDGFVYTVQLVNNENFRFLDPQFLRAGTKYFLKTSVRGEHGEKFADLGEVSAGYREFYNFIGNGKAHRTFGVSTEAELMMRNGARVKGVPVTELWSWEKGRTSDPSITNLETMMAKKGKEFIRKQMEEGKLSRTFVTNLEKAALTAVGTDIETNLMWGRGGTVNTDGPERLRMSVGLWAQLEQSPRRIYNRGQFSLDLFRTELMNFYGGRVDFKGPDSQREIIVQTGLAGMKMVSEAIQKIAFAAGLGVDASEKSGIGAISGKAMDLEFGFAFTKFKIPYLANVKFVVNPAFDNYQANDIENPIVDGYRLSSYSFVIFDVTDQGNDNIFLLKKKWDSSLRWWYQNGTIDYMGRNGHASTGSFSGYMVFMEQAHQGILVKDPTRVLKVLMRNPINGKTIG